MLKTVDFERVHVDVFLVEADGSNREKDAQIRSLLTENGFRSAGKLDRRSEWFVHSTFVPTSRIPAEATQQLV